VSASSALVVLGTSHVRLKGHREVVLAGESPPAPLADLYARDLSRKQRVATLRDRHVRPARHLFGDAVDRRFGRDPRVRRAALQVHVAVAGFDAVEVNRESHTLMYRTDGLKRGRQADPPRRSAKRAGNHEGESFDRVAVSKSSMNTASPSYSGMSPSSRGPSMWVSSHVASKDGE